MTRTLPVSISIERPAGADNAALIEERIAHSQVNLPPQSIHSFSLSQLDKPDITSWTARMGADLTGRGALKRHSDGTGEIKSMFVRPAWRENGISRRLLKCLFLETGTDALQLESSMRISATSIVSSLANTSPPHSQTS
jgi:putative acetyltransferase